MTIQLRLPTHLTAAAKQRPAASRSTPDSCLHLSLLPYLQLSLEENSLLHNFTILFFNSLTCGKIPVYNVLGNLPALRISAHCLKTSSLVDYRAILYYNFISK